MLKKENFSKNFCSSQGRITYKSIIGTLFSFFFFFLLPNINYSIAAEKRPRVIELEHNLSTVSGELFVHRFPGTPYSISVEVTPESPQAKEASNLPYFDEIDTNKIDVWADENISAYQLLAHVQKIKIVVNVPVNINDVDLGNWKDLVISHLGLKNGRDEFIVSRTIPVEEVNPFLPKHWPFYLGISILFLLLLFVILKLTAKDLKIKVKMPPPAPAGASGGAPPPLPPQASQGDSGASSGNGGGGMGFGPGVDLSVSDPLRLAEVLQQKISAILASGTFPTLNDMALIYKLCLQSPAQASALIYQFPADEVAKILKYSNHFCFLEALATSGGLSSQTLMLAETMLRNRALKSPSAVAEQLFITIWRLGSDSEIFFKTLPQEESLKLLYFFPKDFSLPIARNLYPGAWGSLLDESIDVTIPEESQLLAYKDSTVKIKPYFDQKDLALYKKQKELLVYVKSAAIDEEREIYKSVQKNSFLAKVRPPFFEILDCSPELFKPFFLNYHLDQWALALINEPRTYIKKVFDELDEKKSYLFSTRLKTFDQGNFSQEDKKNLREKMATAFQYYLKEKEILKAAAQQAPAGVTAPPPSAPPSSVPKENPQSSNVKTLNPSKAKSSAAGEDKNKKDAA